MKIPTKILGRKVLITMMLAHVAFSQTASLMADNANVMSLRMFVDPSSTKVSLGTASLTVSPLTHKKGSYDGDYQLKVSPYYFKSQKGALGLLASDELVQKLAEGKPVEFTGKATNSADGTVKVVKGKAIPANNEKGAVTFSILTDNGEMVFKTSYHLAN